MNDQQSNCVRALIVAGTLLLAGCGLSGLPFGEKTATQADALQRVTEKGPVKLTVRVSPKEPRLSDLIEVDLQVDCPAGIEIKSPTFGQAMGDFLVRDYGERKANRTTTEQTNTHHFRYQLEPISSGRHLIRSITIPFVDSRERSEQHGATTEIESEPIEVNVTSELGDQIPDLANLEPMLPPRSVDQPSSILWWLIAAGVLASAVIAFVLLRRRQSISLAPPEKTPQEIAHAALKALLSEDLPARGQLKEFYVRLTGIVRYFIEGTTGLRAPEQTTEEFLAAMRTREVFSPSQSVRLKEFLEAADMVKYAGQQPDQQQVDMSIHRAQEFVDFRESLEDGATQQP